MRRLGVLLAFVYGLAFPFAFAWLVSHHREGAMALVTWLRSAGWLGVVVFASVYLLGSALLVPVVVMSALGGFLFGPVKGLLVTSPINALGALTAFLIGRVLLRRWIAPLIASNPRVAAIDRAVGNQGMRLTLLLRLSPMLPHNMMNYAMATTRVRGRDFWLGTWIGALPIVAVQVFAGSRAQNVAELTSRRAPIGAWSWVITGVGIAATITVVVMIARAAQRELTRMMDVPDVTAATTTPPRS